MQTELRETYPQLRISLLGINEEGHEFGSSVLAEEGDIPWLQDVDADNNDVSDVWYDLWQITFRDVLILDADNSPLTSMNLSQSNLGEPESYASLRDLLLDAAMQHQKPYQNPADPLDIDDNGSVIPLDVLIIVNELNLAGSYTFPPLQGTSPPTRFYDSNGDGDVTPLDALRGGELPE